MIGNNTIYFQTVLDDNDLEGHPELIWNIDECGINCEHDPPKVMAENVPGSQVNMSIIPLALWSFKEPMQYIIYM